jgi:hypothetical protein
LKGYGKRRLGVGSEQSEEFRRVMKAMHYLNKSTNLTIRVTKIAKILI